MTSSGQFVVVLTKLCGAVVGSSSGWSLSPLPVVVSAPAWEPVFLGEIAAWLQLWIGFKLLWVAAGGRNELKGLWFFPIEDCLWAPLGDDTSLCLLLWLDMVDILPMPPGVADLSTPILFSSTFRLSTFHWAHFHSTIFFEGIRRVYFALVFTWVFILHWTTAISFYSGDDFPANFCHWWYFFPVVENGTAKDTVSARLDALTQTEIKIRERKHPPVPALYELYQTLAQARKQRKISGNEVNAHSITGNNPLLLCGSLVVLSIVTNTIWFWGTWQ